MMKDILEKISSETGMSEDDIREKIEEKKTELSGLVSDEGAAYIIARELGITIRKVQRLNIGNIIAGMQNVDAIGKITRMYPVKDFDKDGKKGRVCSATIGDETGTIRMSLWNDEIEKISEFKEGDVIQVKGFVKEGLFGPELRIGKYGSIAKSDEVISDVMKKEMQYERCHITELAEGQHRQIRSPIVQVFDGN